MKPRLEILCVCRRPPAWVTDATAEYAKRLPRELKLAFTYIAPGHDKLDSLARRRDEGTRVAKKLDDGQTVIALDERGIEGDSRKVAGWLTAWREQYGRLAFVVGGADGLDEALLARARFRWSLSRLTLPHQLVQVLLAEQLYRAWSITAGHPYHRD